MDRPSALEDPDYAAFAWGRYRKLMLWMTLFSMVVVAVILTLLKTSIPSLPILIMVMIFVGLMVTLLLTAALMGLVFLSSGSGHDESVIEIDPVEPQ